MLTIGGVTKQCKFGVKGGWTRQELVKEAKRRKLSVKSSMNKSELCDLLATGKEEEKKTDDTQFEYFPEFKYRVVHTGPLVLSHCVRNSDVKILESILSSGYLKPAKSWSRKDINLPVKPSIEPIVATVPFGPIRNDLYLHDPAKHLRDLSKDNKWRILSEKHNLDVWKGGIWNRPIAKPVRLYSNWFIDITANQTNKYCHPSDFELIFSLNTHRIRQLEKQSLSKDQAIYQAVGPDVKKSIAIETTTFFPVPIDWISEIRLHGTSVAQEKRVQDLVLIYLPSANVKIVSKRHS